MDEDELKEVDNKKDFDIEYHLESTSLSTIADEDIDMGPTKQDFCVYTRLGLQDGC
ncbi:hypothetical protein SO802_005977 [Lithocarpus litseifolius]|uniref:Uncharacterized protein n=1 Tax=Lithocarpus litseifolius TaxID=425828 RepID=A0AAW2DMW9_9ROSI